MLSHSPTDNSWPLSDSAQLHSPACTTSNNNCVMHKYQTMATALSTTALSSVHDIHNDTEIAVYESTQHKCTLLRAQHPQSYKNNSVTTLSTAAHSSAHNIHNQKMNHSMTWLCSSDKVQYTMRTKQCSKVQCKSMRNSFCKGPCPPRRRSKHTLNPTCATPNG